MTGGNVPDDDVPVRRLILLRHAKSDWPAGVPDEQRPLAERGVRDATRAGTELAVIARPDLVLCSPARRTRQTWRLVSPALHPTPTAHVEPALYGLDAEELIDLVRLTPGSVQTAVVIGHEPTMSRTSIALAGPGSDADALARLKIKYPTCGLAVLRLTGAWRNLKVGTAALEKFLVPRG